jgi:hypothetical protein
VSLMFERRRDKPSPTAVIDRVSSGWSHLISTHLASDSRCKCDGTNKHRHARAVRSAVMVLQFFTRTHTAYCRLVDSGGVDGRRRAEVHRRVESYRRESF